MNVNYYCDCVEFYERKIKEMQDRICRLIEEKATLEEMLERIEEKNKEA